MTKIFSLPHTLRCVVAFFLLFFATLVSAKPEIHNDSILPDAAYSKISEMIDELHAKTGVSVYLYTLQSLNGKSIIDFEKNVSLGLQKPYVLLVLASAEQKVDMLVSDDLQKRVDKNRVLNKYIIPILAAKDEQPLNYKYSAALLNGVGEICDTVADSFSVKLQSSIGNESQNVINIVRIVFYSIIVVSLLAFFYQFLKRRGFIK